MKAHGSRMRRASAASVARMLSTLFLSALMFMPASVTYAAGGQEEKGAGAPASVKEPVTMKWMVWGGADRKNAQIKMFMDNFPDLAKPIAIEVVSGGPSDVEMHQALRLAIVSGKEMPDLVEFNYNGMLEFASESLLRDLTDWMRPYEKDLLAGAAKIGRYDGRLLGVPQQIKPKVWYYRKDMFEKAGVDVARVKSFDDLIEAGKQFHRVFSDSYLINMGPTPIHYWYSFILSNWDDIRIANEDGTYNITKDARFKTLFEWTKEVVTSGIAYPTDDWSPDWQPATKEGKIGSFLISSWMTSFLAKFAPDQKGLWDIALWPEFSRYGSDGGGAIVAIPKDARHPEAAFAFAKSMWLTEKGSVEFWRITGLAPTIASGAKRLGELLPTMGRPEGLTEEQWAVMPLNFYGNRYMEPIFQSASYVRTFPYDPSWSLELAILRKHVESYIAGKEGLEEALRGAQFDMESQIGNPYRK